MTTPARQRVNVGTYTQASDDAPHRPESIYVYEFDSETGKLDFQQAIRDVASPSFVAFTKDGRYLFATNELGEFAGVPGGGLSAFAIDAATGTATFINSQPTGGEHPCYVTVDATGRWVLVANYSGGSVTVLPIGEDGRLGEAASKFQSQGHGVNAERQEKAHAHSVIFDPSQQYVLVADLGIDQILVFRFDASAGQLISHSTVSAPSGAGPRHLVFHPNGRALYVTHELDSTVGVYGWDASQGTLTFRQSIESIPAEFTAENTGAELHVAPSGQFLYASNRGHDSISVFAIDAQDALSLVETVPSGGERPRNFALDPAGNYLLSANQDTGNLVVSQVDQTTGKLTSTGSSVSLPAPVCVKFYPGKM